MDERLISYILIGKAANDVTTPLFIGLFSGCFGTLQEIYPLSLNIEHVLTNGGVIKVVPGDFRMINLHRDAGMYCTSREIWLTS